MRRPNEKGAVESDVRYGRQNFLVPVPQVRELEELNAELVDRCRADLAGQSRGKVGLRGERLIEDQAAFRPLPAAPFDASSMPQLSVAVPPAARKEARSG